MEGDTMTTMLALFAGLFCLLAAGLLFGLAVYQMRRNQRAEPPKPGRPFVPAGVRGPTPPPKVSPLPGGPDSAYDEEEAPTVVVNQPGLGSGGGRGPAQVSPIPAPGGRSAGATIIAFDDDDDD